VRPLSARNPRVTRLSRLVRRREERAGERAFVVEGPLLVRAALDAGVPVDEVYLDEGALDRPAVAALVAGLPAGLDPWVLPAGTLDRVGDATTSQGVLATVERVDGPWPAPDRTDLVVVLAELGDPGNVGTLLRAAVAAGAGAVVVAGGVDPTGPKVVRSSAGALFAVDVVTADSPTTALARLHDLGYRTVGTTVTGGEPYDRVDLTGPVAVVLGNEAHGLAPDVVASLDQVVTVPMVGPTESLNVAMAGTVVVFEVLRQRRAAG
jgi:TrmH family RNA methyltransferase